MLAIAAFGALAGTSSALALSCQRVSTNILSVDNSGADSADIRVNGSNIDVIASSTNTAVPCTGTQSMLSNTDQVTLADATTKTDNVIVRNFTTLANSGVYLYVDLGSATNDQVGFDMDSASPVVFGGLGGSAFGADVGANQSLDMTAVNVENTYVRYFGSDPVYMSARGSADPHHNESSVFSGQMPIGMGLDGGSGNDTLLGGPGGDTLEGDPNYQAAGNDFIEGGAGSDYISGDGYLNVSSQHGIDTVSYADHHAPVTVRPGVGSYDDGSSGEGDTLEGDVEKIIGGSGADKLIGTSGKNSLTGGSGNDILIGLGGADHLYGGRGKDRLTGGDARDWFYGQSGIDKLFAKDGKKDEKISCGSGSNRHESASVDSKDPAAVSC